MFIEDVLKRFFQNLFAGVCLILGTASSFAADRSIAVSLGEIPNRAEMGPDGKPWGTYVEIFRRLDDVYEGVSFEIGVFPFARSFNNIASGQADIHFPMGPATANSKLHFVPEPLLELPLVLYSRIEAPLRPGTDWSGKLVEAIGGGQLKEFGIEIGTEDNPRSGLIKVSLGRIDGFIGEQSVVDRALREADLSNIHREYLKSIPLGVAVRNNEAGRELSTELVDKIKTLKDIPHNRDFLDFIFPPYDDWQIY